ncbi:MAG: glycosyltransferase [FCB group bacterium]|nr:glycosyltransferase [FCB group bacterium]
MKVSERLRQLLAYDKLAGPVPRVLVLEGQYWLDAACLRAAQRLGWEVRRVPVLMEGALSRETLTELLEALADFRPDFLLMINLCGMDVHGLLARLLGDLQMPHVAWFVDNPRTILMGRKVYANEWSIAAAWDAEYLEYLREAGFGTVAHLPLAVDTALFNAEPADSWSFPTTFVGDSNTALAERQWDLVKRRPQLAEAVTEAFATDLVTRENFAQGLGALLDANLLATLDDEDRRCAEYYFFTEGTRRLRYGFVGALDNEGIVVRGDEGWVGHCSRLDAPLAYETELPLFYRACEINLNVTSIQMPRAVNQRVFDCPAAGGFLITDAQPDIELLFEPGSEIMTYSSNEECRHLIRFFRGDPAIRREVVARARRRILAEHTYEHRLNTIAALVREAFPS